MKAQIILLTILACMNIAQAAQYKVSKGDVNFTAKGFPAFITIAGKSENISGIIKNVENHISGNFNVDLTTLKTGMDLRDDHMKNKYLEVAKYPSATLIIPKFSQTGSGETQGILKLKGVEKPVKINYTIESSGETMTVKTQFELLLNDFNIGIPSFQGITVAKTIKLSVAFKAIQNKMAKK